MVAALITDTVHTQSDTINVRTLDAPAATPTPAPRPTSLFDSNLRPLLSVGVKHYGHFEEAEEVHGWTVNLQANRAYRVTLYDPTVNEDHTFHGGDIGNIDLSVTDVRLPSHSHGRDIGIAKIDDEDGAQLPTLYSHNTGVFGGFLSPNHLNDPSDPGPTTNVFIAKRTGPHYIFAYSVIADVNYSIRVSEIKDLPNNPSPSARPLF